MTSAEAITTFLGLSLEHTSSNLGDDELLYTLRSEADYVLKVTESGEHMAAGEKMSTEDDAKQGEQPERDQGVSDVRMSVYVDKCPEEMREADKNLFPGALESKVLAEEWEPMRDD
jgi:hypothetical protein